MLIQPWEFLLPLVRSRHHDKLIAEISAVIGMGPLAYAVCKAGCERKELSSHFQNYPQKKESLIFMATTIRFLRQKMKTAEIKAWFMSERDEFDGFTINDMLRDGRHEEIIALAEKSVPIVRQSA